MSDIDNLNKQLDYLNETKQQLKQAITDKGQFIAESDTFRSYVTKVNDIKLGTDTTRGTATNLDLKDGKVAYSQNSELVGTLTFDKFDPEYTDCLNAAKQIEGTVPIDDRQVITLDDNTIYIYGNRLSELKIDDIEKIKCFGANIKIESSGTSIFEIKVYNYGNTTISSKTVQIELYDKTNNLVQRVPIMLSSILPNALETTNASISTSLNNVVNYKIVH